MVNEYNKAIAKQIEDAINNMSCSPNQVAEYMAHNAHRYLQQEFGKICLEFIRLKAKDYKDGRYDGRNEWFCKMAADGITIKDITFKPKYY